MSRKIARITQEKKLLLANEVVESNAKTSLNNDGRLDTDEIIEYPAELEGGRNLLRNSAFANNAEGWSIRDSSHVMITDEHTVNGNPSAKIEVSGEISNKYYNITRDVDLDLLNEGEEYTYSLWVMTPDKESIDGTEIGLVMYKSGEQTDWNNQNFKSRLENNKWIKVEKTFIVRKGLTRASFRMNLTRNGIIYYSSPKLEKGSTATPWTPAPEDLGLNYPDSIQNFNSSISCNNIIVPEFIEGYPFVKPVIDDSLVLWLDGSTGNNYEQTGTWKDLSGNGNDGQLVNFGYTEDSGWGDGGLKFDGVDDYVDCGKINFGTENFTIEMIAKINNIPNQYGGTIIGNRGGLWGQAHTDGVGTELSFPQSRKYIEFRIADGENIKTQSVIFDFTDNKQHHIIAQKTSTEMKIYIDGILKGTVNHTVIGEINGHYSMKIGRRGNTGYFSDTNIYLTRIYNRALTDEEILQNYQAGQCSPLLAMRGDIDG